MLNLSRIKGFLEGSSTLRLEDVILLLFTRSFQVLCFGTYETIATTRLFFFILNDFYGSFSLFLNQCVCFTKKQEALVVEWVPKI